MPGNRPNILFILSDQHAQRVSGCYGDPAGVTPNLDALAATGTVFDGAYCASPICGPSRMSLMTGRQPHENRCWLNTDVLNSGTPTFAHALGAAGYRTALVGRMHFIGSDQTHGFDERLIGDHSSNWPGNPTFSHGDLSGTPGPAAVSVTKSGAGTNAYDLKDRDTAAAAVDWLRGAGTARAGGDDTPFLLTVGFMLPHPPYVADPDDYEAVAGRVPDIRHDAPDKDHPWFERWKRERGIAELDEAGTQRARQAYWGMVRRLDGLIGDVLGALDEAGFADDTLVIYSSDHGDHLGERGLFWKHTFYDESARVPFVLRWPGEVPAGERRPQVFDLTSIPATIAEAAGAPWNGYGRSVLPVARDGAAPWEDVAFSENGCTVTNPVPTAETVVQRMIREGRYKLNYYHGMPPQLFDLEADPDEHVDLADDPAHAETRERLLARVLDGWDPETVRASLEAREIDTDIMRNWARQTRPPEAYRWDMPAGRVSGVEQEED